MHRCSMNNSSHEIEVRYKNITHQRHLSDLTTAFDALWSQPKNVQVNPLSRKRTMRRAH